MLLIENVVGFVRSDHGAMRVLHRGLERINRDLGSSYALHHHVLDAADYGVPQHRRRAIVVASRDGKFLEPPEATHRNRPMRAWDAIGDLPDPASALIPLGTWASELLPSIPEGTNYQWLTAHGGGEELFGYRTRYWSFLLKLARDRPSWTLSASPGPSTGPFHWNNRQLTVRERLRLQSFPDDWSLAGSVRSQLRMAGNATPPLLAEVIGHALRPKCSGCRLVSAKDPRSSALDAERSRARHNLDRYPRSCGPSSVRSMPIQAQDLDHPQTTQRTERAPCRLADPTQRRQCSIGHNGTPRGCSSEAEHELPKLGTRVRFPSPAPLSARFHCEPCPL